MLLIKECGYKEKCRYRKINLHYVFIKDCNVFLYLIQQNMRSLIIVADI